MSIRSIDMQVLVQKVSDVAKVQQAQQVENSNRQQESVQQINHQTNIEVKTVNEPLRNEHAHVHEKQEQKEKEKKSKPKKGNNDNTENSDRTTVAQNKNTPDKNGSHLDIIV
ncbi:MAG: hypothetical protein ABFD08_01480 [Syntrophomonas sp.]